MAKVMIVEDEGILRMSFSIILEKLNQEIVTEASNGADAIALLEEHSVDLVFMDISMEGRDDGVNAARLIKATNPEIKLVFVSAYPFTTFAAALEDIPHDGYIEKPVNEMQFRECLSSLGFLS